MKETVSMSEIIPIIYCLRDQRIMLDSDLANIYGIETRVLNQAVKRNPDRFPSEFQFELSREEIIRISQTVISLTNLKYSKQVRAFTEHGALMAAMVLNSPRAVAMSVYIVRAFIKMREDLASNAAILKRLAEIDKTLLLHDAGLRDIYQKLRPLLAPPPSPPKREIGFHAKEAPIADRVRTARTKQ